MTQRLTSAPSTAQILRDLRAEGFTTRVTTSPNGLVHTATRRVGDEVITWMRLPITESGVVIAEAPGSPDDFSADPDPVSAATTAILWATEAAA